MSIFDFLFGKKPDEAPKTTVAPQTSTGAGATLLSPKPVTQTAPTTPFTTKITDTPPSPSEQIAAKFLKPVQEPKYQGGTLRTPTKEESATLPKETPIQILRKRSQMDIVPELEQDTLMRRDTPSLKGIANDDVLRNGGKDEIVQDLLYQRILARNEASLGRGAVQQGFRQAGAEAVNAIDVLTPGYLATFSPENKIKAIDSFLEKYDPVALQKSRMLSIQDENPLARTIGATGEAIVESLLPAGVAVKAISVVPWVARMRTAGRAGVYAANILSNTAAQLAATSEMALTRGQGKEEFLKNLVASPSVLLPFGWTAELAIAPVADYLAGKALGMDDGDAMMNAAMGFVGAVANRSAVKAEVKALALKHAESIVSQAQHMRGDPFAVQKLYDAALKEMEGVMGENRMLALKPKEKGVSMGESRPAGLTGPEPAPENPLRPKVPENTVNQNNSLVDENTPDTAKSLVDEIFNAPKTQSDVARAKAGVKRGIKEIIAKPEKLQEKSTVRSGVRGVETAKDITVLQTGWDNLFRNTRRVFGENSFIKAHFLDPFDKSKGALVDARDAYKTSLKTEVVDKLGIKRKSAESADLQDFGEKIISKEDLVKKYGEERAGNIVKAEGWFRSAYDDLLAQYNNTMRKIYPNNQEKLVPRRDDYFHHFQDLTGEISALQSMIETPGGITPALEGVSPYTKPKSKFAAFAQKRLGTDTAKDAVGGFLKYLEASTYGIHINEHIGKFRALADALSERTAQSKNLNNYIRQLRNFSNDLAGKSTDLDRFVVDNLLPGGRKTMRAVQYLNNRVKKNTILGNLGNSIAQAGNVPQAVGILKDPVAITRGLEKTMTGLLYENPEMAQSIFIKERYSGGMNEGFEKGIVENATKFAAWITQSVDKISTRFIWNSAHQKAKINGVANPIKWADDFTREMVQGRGIGELPLAQKSKIIQVIAPFQAEVGNAIMVLSDRLKQKDFGSVAGILVASFLFNSVAEKIRGNRITYDPINALIDGIANIGDDDSALEKTKKIVGRQAGELLSNIPMGQTIAGALVNSNEGTAQSIFGKDTDPTRFGAGLLPSLSQSILTGDFLKAAARVLPPVAGVQLEKSLRGYQAYMAGEVRSASDKEQLYEVEQSPRAFIQNILFGKYSTKKARTYFDSKSGKSAVDTLTDLLTNMTRSTNGSSPLKPERPPRPERAPRAPRPPRG